MRKTLYLGRDTEGAVRLGYDEHLLLLQELVDAFLQFSRWRHLEKLARQNKNQSIKNRFAVKV